MWKVKCWFNGRVEADAEPSSGTEGQHHILRTTSPNQNTRRNQRRLQVRGHELRNGLLLPKTQLASGVAIYVGDACRDMRSSASSLICLSKQLADLRQQETTMGHSSKHSKSKGGRSKRDDGKGAGSREKTAGPSITQLQALIANIKERQLSLARQHEEYTHLQEQTENFQERLEEAEYTLSLL